MNIHKSPCCTGNATDILVNTLYLILLIKSDYLNLFYDVESSLSVTSGEKGHHFFQTLVNCEDFYFLMRVFVNCINSIKSKKQVCDPYFYLQKME